MLEKALLIVSDKFHNFAIHKNVITKSELYHLLNADNVALTETQKTRLIPGQGFSRAAISDILNLAETAKNAHLFDFSLWYRLPNRASKKLTHKHKPQNILVSVPIRQSDNQFNMNILIDEDCEMMHDHQTGLHVQGMLLLEASRQGYLAIFEKFKKQHAIMDMEILQCGSSSASFSLDMTMMANKRIISMESKLANQSLDEHISHLINNTKPSEVAHA